MKKKFLILVFFVLQSLNAAAQDEGPLGRREALETDFVTTSTDSPSSAPVPETSFQATKPGVKISLRYATVNCYRLNFRDRPGTQGKIFRTLKRGTRVSVLHLEDNGWVKVSVDGVVGYVFGEYLEGILPPPTTGGVTPVVPAPPADPGTKPKSPIKYPANSVNTHNSDFPGWLSEALQKATKLNANFPSGLTNKFGQPITRDMVIKMILYNESRGIHAKNGTVIVNPWGFTGWMQISNKVAQGALGPQANQWKDPRFNLIAGTKFMGDCMVSASPPPKNWKIYRPGESDQERLLKAIVGYNRGPYHSRLKQSWNEVVRTTSPTQKDYMAEGVRYGIQTKMGLGLEITRQEKDWLIAHSPRFNSDADIEKETNRVYAYVQNM